MKQERSLPIRNAGCHLAAVALMVTACTGEGPLAPTAAAYEAGDVEASMHAVSVADVSGLWNWSGLTKLTMPAEVAEMFGIPVEGQLTHFQCESAGTLQLVQDGNTFSGIGERTSITCETKGGITFVPPAAFAPPFFPVEDGTLRGRSFHFVTGGPLPAPHHGVVSSSVDGVATALKGTARTIIPGHPSSPLPFEPPPGGTSKTIQWEAVRP